jgi:two-component system phosphate regulon response regulator OmpR
MAKSKKILVVDDDPDIVEYLGSFLEDHGYLVYSANRSSSALDQLDRVEPDAVIVDVILPGRSGLDLLVNIRRHERWSELPVVMVTGDDAVVRDKARAYLDGRQLERGADCVLAKPLDREVLIRHLSTLIEPGEDG